MRRSLEVNPDSATDPLGVLAALGGFEIAGLVGVILEAASQRRPVVLDGFISTAAALVAAALAPRRRDYLIAGHRSQEPGLAAALAGIGLRPLLDLDLRLGEGTRRAAGASDREGRPSGVQRAGHVRGGRGQQPGG